MAASCLTRPGGPLSLTVPCGEFLCVQCGAPVAKAVPSHGCKHFGPADAVFRPRLPRVLYVLRRRKHARGRLHSGTRIRRSSWDQSGQSRRSPHRGHAGSRAMAAGFTLPIQAACARNAWVQVAIDTCSRYGRHLVKSPASWPRSQTTCGGGPLMVFRLPGYWEQHSRSFGGRRAIRPEPKTLLVASPRDP
jgi:hypothetical protein